MLFRSALVTGHELDDHAAETVERETGDSVVVMLGDKVVAASGFAGRGLDRAAVGAALSKVGEASGEVDLLGSRFLAAAHAFPSYRGAAPLRYVVARSIDEAMAPAREIVFTIYAIAAVAIAAGLVIALALSRRLTRPIDGLVTLTQQIAAGKLDSRAEPRGAVEIVTLAGAMNRMVEELQESRRNMSAKDRLQRELEIASRIQTSILPRDLRIPGYDVSAAMLPAEEVGGDYYDVIPVEGGLWVGIGDVAGHGLTAGLVMLMVQSVIAALVLESPRSDPSKIVRVLNSVLYENIRQRLSNDEHVTFSLLRFDDDGRFTFAGAHEEMLLLRAGAERCERIETPGTWLGAIRDVGAATSDAEARLAEGDLLVLYTDGATEGRNEAGQQLDLDGLAAALERGGSGTAEQVRDRLLEAVVNWTNAPVDDVTILVLRYLGPEGKAALCPQPPASPPPRRPRGPASQKARWKSQSSSPSIFSLMRPSSRSSGASSRICSIASWSTPTPPRASRSPPTNCSRTR